MRKSAWLSELPLAACCVIACCVPFPFIYATAGIWLLALCWLIGGDYRATWVNYRSTPAYWFWLVYFLLFAAGYYYSFDKDQSFFDTISKLSFVLLPLLVGAGTKVTLRGLAAIVLSFVAGMVAVSVFCLLQAWQLWQHDHDLTHFFYHELTRGLDANAVYMAWYTIGALAGMLLFPWREAGHRWMLWCRWPVILFLSGFLFCLASRLMLLSYLLIVIPAFGMRLFHRYRLMLLIPLLTIAIGISGIYILTTTNNPIRKRFSDVMHPDMSVVLNENFHGTEPQWSNLTLRLFVWHVALENMQEHRLWWRGTGNGDAYIYQNTRFEAHGIPNMKENSVGRSTLYKVNLHNMYLQSLLMLGIPGLILFIMIVFGPMLVLHRATAAWLFGVFHLVAILFMAQESALQTQAGVIYYCLFSSVFWAGVKSGVKRGGISKKRSNIES